MSDVGEKSGLKPGYVITLAIMLALNLLWIICFAIVASRTGSVSTYNIASIVIWGVAVFYGLYGYKKPHGNLMRYLLLLYAVVSAWLMLASDTYPTYVDVVYLAKIILVVYMAGRLGHYVQNVIISAAVLICNGVIAYYLIDMIADFGMPMTFVNLGTCVGCVTVWLAIAASYIIRYQLHRDAGLADKN